MISWSDIDIIRNNISAYEPKPIKRSVSFYRREYARIAMRRLYARRRKMGLNAHGKPFANKSKTNKRYAAK